jgi:hypothetical protein
MADRDWIKPTLWGALGGAVLTMIVGFSWGGWVTGGSAQAMATAEARTATIAALVPVCLEMARTDPDRAAKITAISEAPTHQRRQLVIDAGWATAPGAETPNRDLAQACMGSLDLTAV